MWLIESLQQGQVEKMKKMKKQLELLAEEIDTATADLLTTVTSAHWSTWDWIWASGKSFGCIDDRAKYFQESYHGGQMNGSSARR